MEVTGTALVAPPYHVEGGGRRNRLLNARHMRMVLLPREWGEGGRDGREGGGGRMGGGGGAGEGGGLYERQTLTGSRNGLLLTGSCSPPTKCRGQ